MTIDPRTPVLVGAAAVQQRQDDPTVAVEALELMVQATRAAAADAEASGLLGAIEQVSVPEGTWSYPDPGRLLAERLGASGARTVLADVGITQQEVIGEACTRIAAGHLDVLLVAGGEARYRALRARLAGLDAPETAQPEGTHPDERTAPQSLGIHDLELVRNAVTPSTAYALIESARRHHLGLDGDAHRRLLGDLYASMAAVATTNPYAWDRHPYSAEEIVTPSVENRMIASPYPKLMCSQWNVDQAAAMVICSVGAAERFGVSPDRWVFPHSSAVSNHAVPVLQRAEPWRSPNSEVAAATALAAAGIGVDDLAHLDLYSCFPAAVQTFADAVGLALDGTDDRPVTVSGGMSLAGGPLNNYMLMALAALVPRLRNEPAAFGLSSSVSGFLTKSGFGVWSATPPAGPFLHQDLTDRAAAAGPDLCEVDADHAGRATIVAWSVDHDRGAPHRAVVFVDTPDGRRTMGTTGDADTCVALLEGEWIGTPVDVRADGSFSLG